MSLTLAGFAYFELRFDADGGRLSGADELLTGLPATGAKHLFVMSHGWNNDLSRAHTLFARFFDEIAAQLASRDGVALAGVVWPAMRWPDEGDPDAPVDAGGAASIDAKPRLNDGQLVASLKEVFPDRGDVLNELGALLERRPDDPAALDRFQKLVGQLATPCECDDEDNQEQTLLDAPAKTVFARSARQALVRGGGATTAVDGGGAAMMDRGGAASTGLGRLWDGAKQVLRQTTYWEMKKRAGRVGVNGLGPLLVQLHAVAPQLRVHLIGHSFGARVISFTLQGLGADPPTPSPVKSAFLVQGAFSHYAFAASLPHAPERAGALAGMQQRVDGPLLVTHSVHDLAVGRLYPVASLSSGDDAAAVADMMERWEAMGHDGAQAVDAQAARLGAPGTHYDVCAGQFLNLDADDVISHGRPPAGAHGDIFHPQLAWAALSAAGLATGRETDRPT